MKKLIVLLLLSSGCQSFKPELEECTASLLDLYRVYKVTYEDLLDCADQKGGEEAFQVESSPRASGY